MLGHVGLAGAETIDELAHVLLAVIEQRADDAETSRVTQDAESLGDVFEQFWRAVPSACAALYNYRVMFATWRSPSGVHLVSDTRCTPDATLAG